MSHKLLLADDSVTIQRVIELTFADEDIQVVTVADGDEAIERIPIERPDIVLADIGMRRRSGYEVAAFVKQHPQLSHVPVLLLAGAFEPVDEARARQVKSDGILVKPFEPQQVIARVRQLVGAGARDSASAAREVEGSSWDSAPGSAEQRPPSWDSVTSEFLDVGPDSDRRNPSAESRVAGPESRSSDNDPAATSLDEYFERLDAAFATLSARTPPPPRTTDRDDLSMGKVPTIEDVLSGASLRAQPEVATPVRIAPPPAEPPDSSPTLMASPPAPAEPAPQRNPLADAFHFFFSVEQGDAEASSVRIGPVSPHVDVTDELVDRITRSVLARLAPDTARSLVADVVSEIAERLVREEIDRIRKTSSGL